MRATLAYLLFSGLGLILGSESGHANTSWIYSVQQSELYEIVVASSAPDSKLEPGIYRFDAKTGDSVPLLLGEVVGANRGFKGILAHVSGQVTTTSSHDAIAIVDGRITFFNHNTTPKGGFIKLGGTGKTAIQPVDVVQGTPIDIPLIKSKEDVTLIEGFIIRPHAHMPSGAKFYLMSIRAPSPLGSGLTLGFAVEGETAADKKVQIVGQRAVVLGYDFMDEGALDRMLVRGTLVPENIAVYSPAIIAKFKNQLVRMKDNALVGVWLDQLSRFQKYLQEGVTKKTTGVDGVSVDEIIKGVPSYQVFDHREQLAATPFDPIYTSSRYVIGQYMDPVTGNFGLIQELTNAVQTIKVGARRLQFVDSKDLNRASIAHVRVDKAAKSEKYLFHEEASRGDLKTIAGEDSFFFISNGRPMMLTRLSDQADRRYSIFPIEITNVSDGDQFAFRRRRMQVADKSYQVFFIHRKRARAKKTDVWVMVLRESSHDGDLEKEFVRKVYEGASLSVREMDLRIVEHENDLLFDNISPANGPAEYLKASRMEPIGRPQAVFTQFEVPRKSTPYLRVMSPLGGEAQQYLRSLSSSSLIPGLLTYRAYDPKGAKEDKTGFYLMSKSPGALMRGFETFYPGKPLLASASKTSEDGALHVLQSKRLQADAAATMRWPPIRVTLVPYTQKASEDAAKFQLGIVFSADRSESPVDGVFLNATVPLPYKALSFTQIVNGEKTHSDEFTILLFFRADPKIKGSVDVVISATGHFKWTTYPNEHIEVDLQQFHRIHKGVVTPAEVKSHLLVDAAGQYYWNEDPNGAPTQGRVRLRKLANPGDALDVNRLAGKLREPDNFKETEVGLASELERYSGRWEIYGNYNLLSAVPGLREAIDKRRERAREKKASVEFSEASDEEQGDLKAAKKQDMAEGFLIDSFESYLDHLVADTKNSIHSPLVILVDQALKDRFKLAFFSKLAEGHGPFSLANAHLRYYHANGALDDVEISEELKYIIGQKKDKPSVLYVESDLLMERDVTTRALNPIEDLGDDDHGDSAETFSTFPKAKKSPFPQIEGDERANLMALVASEGKYKSSTGLKKFGVQENHLPMITIATPAEWRAIQNQHSKEVAAGAIDSFNVNTDFLTSSWTVWPPRSDSASEEMKELTKVPYRSEEMRIFPTLEAILNEAASGQMKGKQRIVLVPDDLKPLVQRLIMLRWATPDMSSGSWSHRNRSMVLHRIAGADSGIQPVVRDNFRALRGAAHSRNSILYADLETVIRVGRPVKQGADGGFKIHDPIKASDALLLERLSPSETPKEDPEKKAADEVVLLEDLDNVDQEIQAVNGEIENLMEKLGNLEREEHNYVTARAGGISEGERVQGMMKKQMVAGDLKRLQKKRLALEERMEALFAQGMNKEEMSSSRAPNRAPDSSAYPHLMWWIAAEGQAVQPKKRADWSLKNSVDYSAATILVGTESELQRLHSDMSFENKFLDLDKHFEIVRLQTPDEDTKFELVQQLFDRPEISSLGIQFVLKEDNGREPRSQLIYHFINRIDQLAYDQKVEKTSAFIRAFVALKNSLTEDLELRRSRVITEKFIERLFTKVFPMSLNPDILENSDPLIRMRNQDQAVRDLQSAGYKGSSDLKRRFFDTILSQTRPTDTSRPIPNSQILFGATSTGKSHLLRTLFKMLDYKEYRRNASNQDADYIFVNVAKLTAERSDEADKMAVDEIIADILDLMALPKGPRASIALDDVHKASKGVREKLLQFVASIFEAPNGMFMVRSRDGKRMREIPVQNLNIYMTLNPTSNEAVRRQYVKDSHKGIELLKREVLAALSGDGFEPEESFLARWSDIINLDNFPRSAKVPELVQRVRANAIRSGQLVLVDPLVVDHLIDAYPSAHARELLSPATAALTALPSTAERAPLYIVSPRDSRGNPAPMKIESAGTAVSQQELVSVVRQKTQIDAIRLGDQESLFRLMGFIMRNFRLQVFNHLSLEAHMSDQLRIDSIGQSNILKTNVLLGLSTHVMDQPRIPTSEIQVKSDQFGFLSRAQLQELIDIQILNRGSDYFPISLERSERPLDLDLEGFIKGKTSGTGNPRTRRDVLVETVGRLEVILQKALQIYLRLEPGAETRGLGQWGAPQIQSWFQKLNNEDPEKEFLDLSRQILSEYMTFQVALHSPDLVDVRHQDGSFQPSLYDTVRLFAFALDKAIVRLPWGHVAQFTLNVADQASDFSLGTRSSFREYVGTHQLSVFTISTPEFMADMYRTSLSGAGKSLGDKVENLKKHFDEVCSGLLTASRQRSE